MPEPHRLPILETARRAYQFLGREIARLSLPLATLFLFTVASTYVGQVNATQAGIAPFLQTQGLNLVIMLVSAAAAVGVHRWILRGEVRDQLLLFRWDRNLVRYFVLLVVIWIAMMVLMALGTVLFAIAYATVGLVLGILVLGAALLLMAWCFARLGPVLPGAAIANQDPLAIGLRITRGQGWRIVALTIVVFAPWLVLTAVMTAHVFAAHRAGQTIVPMTTPILLLSAAFQAVYTIVGAAMLSYTYEALTDDGTTAARPPVVVD